MTQVSIVMSVFNGGDRLAETLDSLFAQREVNPEILVVNDGSQDNTASILDEYARYHSNLKILNQVHKGLTEGLIAGCSAAQGEFIARQDCGDYSAPFRIKKQIEILRARPEVAMVSCVSRFISDEGHLLYAASGRADPVLGSSVTSPSHHGCVMFRKQVYLEVGGYRSAFFVAQDLDLWSRLQEKGDHIYIEEPLYTATVLPRSITSTRRHIQQDTAKLISAAIQRRSSGLSETPVLDMVRVVSRKKPLESKSELSKYHFFVGGCLRKSNPVEAKHQYYKAIRVNPLHLKAWIRYLQILIKSR